jgi:hypothetical protein
MNVYHTIAVARAGLPRVTLAQRVIDKIVANAQVYETETGESLVGFAINVLGRTEPDLYVLDTIPPDESAIRRGAYFEQGDDLQGDIFNWWFDNWQMNRERHRGLLGTALGAKWDAPLVHLGDWHKHPGTLTEPSWGDTDTARHHIFDDSVKTPQLLALLATAWGSRSAAEDDSADSVTRHEYAQPIKVPVGGDTIIRIDCWYISRLTRRFVRVAPQVMADNLLPSLPIIGWHLAQPERLSQEIEALKREGYAVSIEQYEANDEPPLEVCLTLARRAGHNILIVVTEADYPASMPTIRVTPMAVMKQIPESADLFANLWAKSEPLPKADYPSWQWTANRTVLDLVQEVEAKLVEKNSVS